jgi:hypothetical protein
MVPFRFPVQALQSGLRSRRPDLALVAVGHIVALQVAAGDRPAARQPRSRGPLAVQTPAPTPLTSPDSGGTAGKSPPASARNHLGTSGWSARRFPKPAGCWRASPCPRTGRAGPSAAPGACGGDATRHAPDTTTTKPGSGPPQVQRHLCAQEPGLAHLYRPEWRPWLPGWRPVRRVPRACSGSARTAAQARPPKPPLRASRDSAHRTQSHRGDRCQRRGQPRHRRSSLSSGSPCSSSISGAVGSPAPGEPPPSSDVLAAVTDERPVAGRRLDQALVLEDR